MAAFYASKLSKTFIMTTRLTRASAARAAAVVENQTAADLPPQLPNAPASPTPATNKAPNKRGAKAQKSTLANSSATSEAKADKPAAQTDIGKKRKRTGPRNPSPAAEEELPHGLGTSLAPFSKTIEVEEATRESSEDKKLKIEDLDTAGKESESAADVKAPLPDASKASPTKKGRRPAVPYGHRFGETPFPDFGRPTPEECRIVNDLLTSVHGEKKAPAAIPAPSETFAGCGEVPSVLDALIRTVLSANTSGANSGVAIKALIDTFGTLAEGTGKGSVDWDKVRRTPAADVAEAIKGGGNQHTKSRYIKGILDMSFAENNDRRAALANPDTAKDLGLDNDSTVQRSAGLSCADPSVLSLDHMHALSYHDAFAAFIKYPGVALKTASCVCLYCLQRPSFAVDTHVQRITGWLGWRPEKSDENKTFSHLEYMIPDDLKYSLHTLFVKHGKECVRCNARSHEGTEGWENGCVIDHLVQRLKNAEKKKMLKSTAAKQGENGDESDGSLHEYAEDAPEPKPQSKPLRAKSTSEGMEANSSVGDQLSSKDQKPAATSKTRKPPAKKAGKKGKADRKGKRSEEKVVEGGGEATLEQDDGIMQVDSEEA